MARQAKLLAITAGGEAVLIVYGSLAVFFTPSGAQRHGVLLAVVLLGIAAPLVWHAASVAQRVPRSSDPLMLRVVIPNGALLVLWFSGSLESGSRPYGLLSGVVAGVALVLIASVIRLTRTRLAEDASSVRS